MNCQFPTCQRHPQKNGYCVSHHIYASVPTENKTYSIPKRSEKMKDQMKEYKKKAKAFLSRPENLKCKVQMKGCTKLSQVIHHTRGRTGSQLTNEKDWMPSCAFCNIEIERLDAEAREKGVKKSRITKVVK